MKNKIIILFISIFSIFFLFSSNVLAFTSTVPADIVSLTDDDYNKLKDLISSNNISSYIVIYYYNSSTGRITDKRLWTNPTSLSCSDNNGFRIIANNLDIYAISDDFSTLTYRTHYNSLDITGGVYPTYQYIILSSVDFSYPELCSSSYSLIYEDNTYTMPTSNDLRFYTIYDIYDSIHGDSMPLLTDFFTIVIDKLNLICQFFTSNYIYLSIFVIFIFYFVILLIRRFI